MIPKRLDYCSQACLERDRIGKIENTNTKDVFPDSIKTPQKKQFSPETNKLTINPILNVEQAIFAIKDKDFQRGLSWRMKQCLAVRCLISKGWKADAILKEFRHNGMTEQTARKIIEDALC